MVSLFDQVPFLSGFCPLIHERSCFTRAIQSEPNGTLFARSTGMHGMRSLFQGSPQSVQQSLCYYTRLRHACGKWENCKRGQGEIGEKE